MDSNSQRCRRTYEHERNRLLFSLCIFGQIMVSLASPCFAAPTPHEENGSFSLKVSKKFEVPIRHSPRDVVWSPDGSRLAVENSLESGVAILDSSGNILTRIFRLPSPGYGRVLSFIDGNSHLLMHPTNKSDASAVLEVRDATTGKVMRAIEGVAPEEVVGRNAPHALAVSPDQKLAAVNTGAHTVIIYDTADWHKLQIINPPKGVVSSLCFSSDGKDLVIGHIDGFSIVNSQSGAVIKEVTAYQSRYGTTDIDSIAISPHDDLLLTIGGGGMENGNVNRAEAIAWAISLDVIRIWRLSDGTMVTSFEGIAPNVAKKPIRQGIWDPKGRYVAFIDANSKLFLWQAMNGGAYTTIDLPSPAYSLAASPDGNSLAVAQGLGITVFNIEQIRRHL